MAKMKKKNVKKTVKKTVKTKAVKTASRKGMRGGSVPGTSRKCGECGEKGHNKRSHLPGSKLAL